jgi:hypothetical protein
VRGRAPSRSVDELIGMLRQRASDAEMCTDMSLRRRATAMPVIEVSVSVADEGVAEGA